jgi:signal transduction histidine kinase
LKSTILIFSLIVIVTSSNLLSKNHYYKIDEQKYFDSGNIIILNSKYNTKKYFLNFNLINSNISITQLNDKFENIGISKVFNNLNLIDYKKDSNYIYLLTNTINEVNVIILNERLEIVKEINVEKILIYTKLDDYKLYITKDYIVVVNSVKSIIYNKSNCYLLYKLNINEKIISEFYDNYYLHLNKINIYGKIELYDYNQSLILNKNITIYDNIRLFLYENFLFILTSIENSNQTFLQIIEIFQNKFVKTDWINSNINNIDIEKDKNIFLIANYLEEKDDNILSLINLNQDLVHSDKKNFSIDKKFVLPIATKIYKDFILTFFINGIYLVNYSNNYDLSEYIKIDYNQIRSVDFINSYLIINFKYNSLVLAIKEDKFYFLNNFIDFLKKFGLIIILIIIALYFIQKYRHLLRIFNQIINNSGSGIIYFVDSKGRLKFTNNLGLRFLDINPNQFKNKQFGFYCKNDVSKKFSEIVSNSLEAKEDKKISFTSNIYNNRISFICNINIIRNIAGSIRGLILVANDITEQLEKEKLSNLAFLAHDMQTNLTTIKLNAELIDTNECDKNIAYKNKILYQVNLLIQKVRDILTVGRDENLDLSIYKSIEIIDKSLNEFDFSLYNNIEIKTYIEEFEIECDINKLTRAFRNSIENSIKHLNKEKGLIIIKAARKDQEAIFSIIDDGIGMDLETQKKILQPFFTTASKKGGSGIGTIIIQKVIELHKGKLNIISEYGFGTEFQFILPIKQIKK